MTSLDAATKSRITRILDTTRFTQQGFAVKYDDDENGPKATITFSLYPEYRFQIHSTEGALATSESPGIHSDTAEVFQRSDLEACINAIAAWAQRTSDRWRDYIIDEFGGEGG